MHRHRNAGLRHGMGQGCDVVLVGMHTAGRHQTHEVTDAAAFLEFLDKADERGNVTQGAVLAGRIDAQQVLIEHPPGADIHMPHFGITELALGQTDAFLGRLQGAVGTTRHKAVPDRRVGLGHGIVPGILAYPPAIEDAEDHRARWVGVAHS